jgi:predicted regulator of Ras-like GTPase activity (Roadblock/LC7/MglB family)
MVIANAISALFAFAAAVLWFIATTKTQRVDPASTDFVISDDGVDILATAKLQVTWNRYAASAACAAALAQSVVALLNGAK